MILIWLKAVDCGIHLLRRIPPQRIDQSRSRQAKDRAAAETVIPFAISDPAASIRSTSSFMGWPPTPADRNASRCRSVLCRSSDVEIRAKPTSISRKPFNLGVSVIDHNHQYSSMVVVIVAVRRPQQIPAALKHPEPFSENTCFSSRLGATHHRSATSTVNTSTWARPASARPRRLPPDSPGLG
jgi:hypothetical protein